ncbi:MAG: type II toxin-antitoxin system RnlB family antitoxin [Pseudomonadota bacterium]
MKRSGKHFEVLEAPGGKAFICFSLDSARPDSYMDELEKTLILKAYEGDVLLDLLVANGESSRRFLRLKFDGQRLHWLKAKPAPLATLSKALLDFCQNFYAAHPAALKNSVLSPAAQHRIKSSSHALA